MSLLEEDRNEDNNSDHGLEVDLAGASATGVGVGAVFNCFNNIQTETPTTEGSTTQGWTCESAPPSTSDTTMSEDSIPHELIQLNDSETESSDDDMIEIESQSSTDTSSLSDEETESDSDVSDDDTMDVDTLQESSDSDVSVRDIATSTHDSDFHLPIILKYFNYHVWNQLKIHEVEKSPELLWYFKDCSICFDVVLSSQDIMLLPCMHTFHIGCILPWLQKQRSCPNCRKIIEFTSSNT